MERGGSGAGFLVGAPGAFSGRRGVVGPGGFRPARPRRRLPGYDAGVSDLDRYTAPRPHRLSSAPDQAPVICSRPHTLAPTLPRSQPSARRCSHRDTHGGHQPPRSARARATPARRPPSAHQPAPGEQPRSPRARLSSSRALTSLGPAEQSRSHRARLPCPRALSSPPPGSCLDRPAPVCRAPCAHQPGPREVAPIAPPLLAVPRALLSRPAKQPRTPASARRPLARQRTRSAKPRPVGRRRHVDSLRTSSVGRITAAGSSPPSWASSTRTISALMRS